MNKKSKTASFKNAAICSLQDFKSYDYVGFKFHFLNRI